MKKQQLINKINKLSWGGIYYGHKDGNLININGYDEESDTFNVYGDDMVCKSMKFEELPTQLWRRD